MHLPFWVCGAALLIDAEETGVATDIGLGTPPLGLAVWDGTAALEDWSRPGEPALWQARYTGTYRELADAEWQALREGRAPWEDAEG